MLCRFSVVPGYCQTLLGMPGIEVLDILTINCHTIDTKPSIEQISRKKTDGWYCTNKTCDKLQDIDMQGKYYKNTDSDANAMVLSKKNSKINYFPPGPDEEVGIRVTTNIKKHKLQTKFKDVFTGKGYFECIFYAL